MNIPGEAVKFLVGWAATLEQKARSDQMEADCLLVCPNCALGNLLYFDGNTWRHRPSEAECKANAIRLAFGASR